MRRTLTLLTLSLALASPALAQGRNSQAPINLNADHIELQDKANRALFSGNVVVKQAEMTLNAQRMTVSYAGQISTGASPEAQRIDASGGVTVTRPTQTARSNFAVYDLKKGVITMLGAVTLIQAGNTVNGGRLTIVERSGHDHDEQWSCVGHVLGPQAQLSLPYRGRTRRPAGRAFLIASIGVDAAADMRYACTKPARCRPVTLR